MNAVQSRCLAVSGVVALCLTPAVAQASVTSAVAVQAQDQAEGTSGPGEDEAEQTAVPGGDDAEQTAGPGEDEAEVTSQPVLEAEDGSGDDDAPEEEGDDVEDTSDFNAPEGDDAVEDESDDDFDIPAGDSGFWEDVLGDGGFVNVTCSFESVNSTIFELNEEPPTGTGWLLLVALADLDEENGIYDIFDQPYPGEAFSLLDDTDVELTLSRSEERRVGNECLL